MADEPLPSAPPGKFASETPPPVLPPYTWLRWTIRLTGVLLMFGGAIYLVIIAFNLVFGKLSTQSSSDEVYVLVVSLLAFALAYAVFRTGLNMLRYIEPGTISTFSFLFALVYTFVLLHLLPASSLFHRHLAWMLLLVLLYFGLIYLILKRILLALLFPRKDR